MFKVVNKKHVTFSYQHNSNRAVCTWYNYIIDTSGMFAGSSDYKYVNWTNEINTQHSSLWVGLIGNTYILWAMIPKSGGNGTCAFTLQLGRPP